MSSSSSGGNMPRLGPAWRSSATGASRGFQPPPAVPDERASSRERSGSHASAGSGASGGGGGGGDKNRNPFAMLDDEDDGGGGANAPPSGGGGTPSGGGGRFSSLRSDNNSSSSASRPYHRTASGGPKPGGRSLADLAAGLGGNDRGGGGGGGGGGDHHNSHHHHSSNHHHNSHRPDHRSSSRSGSTGMPRNRSGSGEGVREDRPRKPEGGRFEGGKYVEAGDDGMDLGSGAGGSGAKVIRYTREKLLSLRGRGDESPPECFKELEGSVVILDVAQDPVCWDTFDSDEVWAAAGRDRRTADRTGPKGSGGRLRDFDSGDEREERPQPRGSIGERAPLGGPPPNRGSFGERDPRERGGSTGGGGFGSGRWQRGMAIPDEDARPSSRGRDRPADRSERSRNDPNYEAENPDDLWDTPVGGAGPSGAAADFSAFGGSLDDGPRGSTGMEAFELSDMSKAAAAFENDLHGDRKGDNGSNAASGTGEEGEGDDGTSHHVDPSRPLASTGTTIRSGSGDHVNVFEDFGDESSTGAAVVTDTPENEDLPIKSGSAENNASSRLMKMIGVSGTGEASGGIAEPAPAVEEPKSEVRPEEPKQEESAAEQISSNPWGAPASSVSSNPWGEAPSGGGSAIGGVSLDSFGRDQQAAKEAEAAAQRKRQEEEQLRLQQQQAAEAQAKVAMQAKQQAEIQAVQQRQQDQVKQQQNQVELVLIERISNILENSWGRSDLNSILSNLHANDSRVIAILATIDALRALIARHPQRIQLGRDPTMGAEMAALRLTNAQWQAHQAQQAQVAAAQQQAAQQEELQRRQRQLQEEQARQQQEAMRAQQALREAEERKKQAAPQVITDAPWFYADPQGNIQGPFSGDEMRQWLEAGYFKGDLPISQNTAGPFKALSSYFSDSSDAFKPTGPSEEEREKVAAAEAQARAEVEARARAEAEAAAVAQARAEADAAAATQAMLEKAAAEEAQARAAAEAQSRAEEEAKAAAHAEAEKASSDRTEQSAQLKMMLGLGAGASTGGGINIAGPPQPEPVAEPAAAPQPEKPKKGKKKQKEQQQQQQPVASETAPVAQAPVVPEPAPAGPPPAPAWGGAATVGRKKSMSEIQQEEAREAARHAKEHGGRSGGGGGGAGGWANIAASGGSTAWGGAALTPAPSVAVGGLAAQQAAAWNTPATAPAAAAKKQSKATATASSKKAAVDNFGANGRMTPTLEAWCKEQMQKLNGSEDLTLVQFCMTLTDRDEIQQYLTAYLGSTPQVNSFASEFIKRKGLGDNGRHHDEWESAGKKGRKKKGGK